MLHHPAMKAYSLDLREKIVVAVRRGMSKAHAARTFGVGATSVKRYVSLAERGRSLEPGTAPGKRSKLGESGMRLLEEDLHERPTVTYENRARLLHRLLGIEVSKATTLEKRSMGASERDEFLRAAWRVMVALQIDAERLVFVDEMGSNTSLSPISTPTLCQRSEGLWIGTSQPRTQHDAAI